MYLGASAFLLTLAEDPVQVLAALALGNLSDLTDRIGQLSETVCTVVAAELTDEDKTIDPTVGGNERHLIGHKMDIEKAEEKFAHRSIDDFPLIIPVEKNTRPQRVSPRPRRRAA